MKKNEGITLIALIITIVILIILTAITINSITSTNLFGLAKGAADNYIQAGKDEEKAIDEMISEVNEIVGGLEGGGSELNGPPTDLTKLELGQYVAYNPTVLDKAGTQPVAGNLLTYTSYQGSGTTSGSGYLNEGDDGTDRGQTFTAKSDLKWVILDINESTGAVTLLSEKEVNTDNNKAFYLKGAVGYLYAEEQLHKACSVYGHGFGADTNIRTTYKVGGPFDEETRTLTGSGARSITMEDINKLAKVSAEKDSEGKVTTTFNELDENYGKDNILNRPVAYPTMSIESGYSTDARQNIQSTYYATPSELIADSCGVKKFLTGNVSSWVATRGSKLVVYQCDGGCGQCVNQKFYTVFWGLWFSQQKSHRGEDAYCRRTRPVVVLKAAAIDTTTEYDENTGWKLQ